MKRKGALDAIFDAIGPSDVTVSTTGLISREVFAGNDSSRNIYVPGSMGLASSIGLALAVCQKRHRVIVIDGDASLLMNLGSMVTVGAYHPENFLHIVLDNGSYGSCSEERSLSTQASFDKIALDVGYAYVRVVGDEKGLSETIKHFSSGPGIIQVKIELGGERDLPRPLELEKIKTRFINFLQTK